MLLDNFISSLFSVSLAFAAVDAYANPRPCTGKCGISHDPSIIRRTSDGTYFQFTAGEGIFVSTAPELSGPWKVASSVVRGKTLLQKNDKLVVWAPDVSKVDDTYYLLYSVSTYSSQDSEMGFAISTDLENWRDMGTTGIFSNNKKPYNAIHGSLIHKGNQHYMVFGSYWSGLYTGLMENIPTKNSDFKQIANQPAGEHAIEAPIIFEYENVWYLFFSAGKCCKLEPKRPAKGEEYQIKACRSRSPTGPFEDKEGRNCNQGGGTTILPSHDWVYAPGGQGFINDPKEGPVIYYHYLDTRVGISDRDKKFGWNRLSFRDDWPYVES